MAQENTGEIQKIYNRLNGSNMVALVSGKGGVGKTWLAVTLAHAFARLGEKVLLVDGDLGLPNVDIQLGLNVSTDLTQVLMGKMPMNQAVINVPSIEADVLAGRSGVLSMCQLSDGQLQLLKDDLYILAQHYDRVFIDLGSGMEKSMNLLTGCVGQVLVLCNEDPASLADAYTVVKSLTEQAQKPKLSVVINMANTQKEGERTYQTLLKACQNFLNTDIELGGILHQDTAVKESVKTQMPFLTACTDSPVLKDIEQLVKHIGGEIKA